MDWKKLTLTQQRHAFTIKSNVLQDKINKKKLKPGLVAWKWSRSILKEKDK